MERVSERPSRARSGSLDEIVLGATVLEILEIASLYAAARVVHPRLGAEECRAAIYFGRCVRWAALASTDPSARAAWNPPRWLGWAFDDAAWSSIEVKVRRDPTLAGLSPLESARVAVVVHLVVHGVVEPEPRLAPLLELWASAEPEVPEWRRLEALAHIAQADDPDSLAAALLQTSAGWPPLGAPVGDSEALRSVRVAAQGDRRRWRLELGGPFAFVGGGSDPEVRARLAQKADEAAPPWRPDPPGSDLEAVELLALLERVELSPRESEVFSLVAGGATPGEVAETLGMDPGAVRVALSRARKKLQARM